MRNGFIFTVMGIGIFLWVYVLIAAFNLPKCEHVFTSVEQANIKVERSIGQLTPAVYSCQTGLQEGKELICVKCFHKQKQMLDYGQAMAGDIKCECGDQHCFGMHGNVSGLGRGALLDIPRK